MVLGGKNSQTVIQFLFSPSQLILRGKVRQVTRDPGELTLSLVWPRLDPITFKATAEHHINTDQELLIIKPTMSLDLTRAKYGFSGEVSVVVALKERGSRKFACWQQCIPEISILLLHSFHICLFPFLTIFY